MATPTIKDWAARSAAMDKATGRGGFKKTDRSGMTQEEIKQANIQRERDEKTFKKSDRPFWKK